MCNFLSSVLSQQKFEVTEVQAFHSSQLSDSVTALGQISVTAPCYSSVLFRKYKENTSLRHESMPTQKTQRGERERQRAHRAGERPHPTPGLLAPLFICFFPPPGPAQCKLG